MYLSNSNKTKTYYLYFVNPLTNKLTSRSCKTKKKNHALKVLREFKFESNQKPGIDKSLLKISDVSEKLLKHYQLNNAINTFRSYRSSLVSLTRHIGDKYINSINKSDLEEFKSKRSKEVNLISTNIDIRNIKAMMNKLIEFEMLDYSRIKSVKQFKIEKNKMLAIDPDDIKRILNCDIPLQLKQIIRFTLFTASRISEVLNVKIKDIDFDNEVINIYQKKTNGFKSIPLTIQLLELINEVLTSENEENIFRLKDQENYLFTNPHKRNLNLKLREDAISKQFKKIIMKLKLNPNFKFHSLRHSSITELIRNNVPLNVVKEIAGHKSITTTMIYSHVKSSDLRQAVNSLHY